MPTTSNSGSEATASTNAVNPSRSVTSTTPSTPSASTIFKNPLLSRQTPQYHEWKKKLRLHVEHLTMELHEQLVKRMFAGLKCSADGSTLQQTKHVDMDVVVDMQKNLHGEIDQIVDDLFLPFMLEFKKNSRGSEPPEASKSKNELRTCIKTIMTNLLEPFVNQLNDIFSTVDHADDIVDSFCACDPPDVSKVSSLSKSRKKPIGSKTSKVTIDFDDESSAMLINGKGQQSLTNGNDSIEQIEEQLIDELEEESENDFDEEVFEVDIDDNEDDDDEDEDDECEPKYDPNLNAFNIKCNDEMCDSGLLCSGELKKHLQLFHRIKIPNEYPFIDETTTVILEYHGSLTAARPDELTSPYASIRERFARLISIRLPTKSAKWHYLQSLIKDSDDYVNIRCDIDPWNINEDDDDDDESDQTKVQSAEKPVFCTEDGCGEAMMNIHQLNCHMFSHGIYPHICHICNRMFDQNLYGSSACTHTWEAHRTFSGEFHCYDCDVRFNLHRRWVEHLHIHHMSSTISSTITADDHARIEEQKRYENETFEAFFASINDTFEEKDLLEKCLVS
ncbi:hypothetical protein RDWZM_005247 [Blomia tropicalis]|uniref:C2H2-type domain-containing protein n=1 Tax=Blomia tropicalis TaxID=40697 RepID=A0A9Q0M5A3_BLOTA|nr:hypothetical protein RDWZM_005247 [Blomia tropicalis]